MNTGGIYARFSSQSQNEQSIEAQVRMCKEFAEGKDTKKFTINNTKEVVKKVQTKIRHLPGKLQKPCILCGIFAVFC